MSQAWGIKESTQEINFSQILIFLLHKVEFGLIILSLF